MVIKGVVFDVDDTLYLERDYVRSGFAHIAASLGTTTAEQGSIVDRLTADFAAGRRGDLFDRLLGNDPALARRATVDDLVDAYRAHRPDIAINPDVAATLDALVETGRRVGVLTDGPPASQAAKVEALGLARWCDPIILTGTLGTEFAKPGTAGFERIAASWGLPGSALAYVADNPAKDFAGPRRLGWLAIRIRQAGQLRAEAEARAPGDAPDAEIASVTEVMGLLGGPLA